MESMNTSLMTIEDLCEALMVGKNAAYDLLKSGEVKSFRIGRKWKIPRDSLNEYIKRQIAQTQK